MAVQFTKNITSRISTVNLQRQLLHALMADKINLQRTLGKHRSDFFTNVSRQFIYDCISRIFNDKRSVLTLDQFNFEIEKRFDSEKDKSRIEDITSEYDIIKKMTQTEDVDNIISNLEEVQLANATDALIREAYTKLEAGEYQEAANLLRQKSIDLKDTQKEGRIINLHKDSDDWFAEVKKRKEQPELYAGIPTGFAKFDQYTGGLFPAELTIVFGLSGKGKSTFMKALTCNIRKQGKVILHCGNEENEFQIRSKYMSADSGEKYKPFKIGTYTDEEFNRLKIYSDNARGVGAIYIYEFPQQTDATWIERAYRCLEMQGVHVDVIVIDYLDLMKPIGTAYSENDEQGKITSDLKQIAINCHCPVVTATQAGTQSEKQEKKEKPFLTAADVFGTKRKVHSANTLIGIVNQTATAMANELGVEDRNKHHMVLCVPKNRDGAVFTFRQIMDVTCGKFYEDTNDNDPTMKNLEKQAAEMIDESLPPDKMRSEIDIKEIQMAKKEDLDNQIKALEEKMNITSSDDKKEDDIFLTGESSAEEIKEENIIKNEEDPFLNESEIKNDTSLELNEENNSSTEDADKAFFGDIKEEEIEDRIPMVYDNSSSSSSSFIEESYYEKRQSILKNEAQDDFTKDPKSPEDMKKESSSATNHLQELIDKKKALNNNTEKLSDKIPHKMSFKDLLNKDKNKGK